MDTGLAHPSHRKYISGHPLVLEVVPSLGSRPATRRHRQSPHPWAPSWVGFRVPFSFPSLSFRICKTRTKPSLPGMVVFKDKVPRGIQSKCCLRHLPPGSAPPPLLLPLSSGSCFPADFPSSLPRSLLPWGASPLLLSECPHSASPANRGPPGAQKWGTAFPLLPTVSAAWAPAGPRWRSLLPG